MNVKTKQEIAILEESGHVLSDILQKVIAQVRIGVSGLELSNYALDLITAAGAVPAFVGYGKPPFPASLCVSVNSCVVHGVPTEYRFQTGDIVGLDIGMRYQGLYTDMARTLAIGTLPLREQKLIDATYQSLERALTVVKPGRTTGDIGHAVQSYIEGFGFGVVRDLAGHGVGHALHEAPEVPNFGQPGEGFVLEAGMVIAIEPMITLGHFAVRIGDDGWSVMTRDGSKAAHVEDTVLVTDNGHRVLTRPIGEKRKYLGIDYGDVHIGLALASGLLAVPYTVVNNDQGFWKMLPQLISDEAITDIVVGWPVRMSGKEGSRTEKTSQFIERVRTRVALPVHRTDERLSTRIAHARSDAARARGDARRARSAADRVDAVAAAEILQTFLDAHAVSHSF